MYRTILLPLDGSPLSEQAIPYAVTLARTSGARIVVVRSADDEMLEVEDPKTGRLGTVDPADHYLDAVRARLTRSGVAVQTDVLYQQAPDAILAAATEHAADLIVMATHGRSGVGRWLFGSVADAVLRRARVPVLVVQPGGSQPWRDAVRFRAAVALDGSTYSEGALPFACELARTMSGDLALIRIVEPPPSDPFEEGAPLAASPSSLGVADSPRFPAPVPDQMLTAARGYLEAIAHRVRALGIGVSIAAREGAPARSLTEVADDWRCSAIIMATHGRGGLTRLVLGSVATETLRLARVPLLLVPPLAVRALATVSRDTSAAPSTAIPLDADAVTAGADHREPALALG